MQVPDEEVCSETQPEASLVLLFCQDSMLSRTGLKSQSKRCAMTRSLRWVDVTLMGLWIEAWGETQPEWEDTQVQHEAHAEGWDGEVRALIGSYRFGGDGGLG